ncbi:MAG: cache domain-containing protein [Pseudomonadota bacterium]
MLKTLKSAILMGALLCSSIACAATGGSADEAVAMVKKAAIYLKEHGRDKTLAEVNNPAGLFVDRDLYVAITDMSGKALANPILPKTVGKDLSQVRDVNGKYFVKERLEMLKSHPSGWIDYKWPNPLSKQIETRSTYFERVDDLVIACGIYKK